MPKKLKPYDDGPENGFSVLLDNTNKEIKAIRKRARDEILEAQNRAGAQARLDFESIGWKKWTTRALTSEGQFERLEQSVVDTQLKIVNLYEQAGFANIADTKGMYKVSDEKCECADFVFNGLPCKHMYLLAGVILKRMKEREENFKK